MRKYMREGVASAQRAQVNILADRTAWLALNRETYATKSIIGPVVRGLPLPLSCTAVGRTIFVF